MADEILALALAELAGYKEGFEGLPMWQRFNTADENMAYVLAFGKARQERGNLIDRIDTLSRLLKEAQQSPNAAALQASADLPRSLEGLEGLTLEGLAQELADAAFDYFVHSELHPDVDGVDKSSRLLGARNRVLAALRQTAERK